jgi:hypothetical protein
MAGKSTEAHRHTSHVSHERRTIAPRWEIRPHPIGLRLTGDGWWPHLGPRRLEQGAGLTVIGEPDMSGLRACVEAVRPHESPSGVSLEVEWYGEGADEPVWDLLECCRPGRLWVYESYPRKAHAVMQWHEGKWRK